MADQTKPWFIGGDFNTVVSVSERSNGVYPAHHSIEEFSEAIFDGGLIDLGFEGSPFTWTDHRLWQRLDRVLFSSEWMDALPQTVIRHLPRSSSDHSPLLIQTSWMFVKENWSFPTTSSGMGKVGAKLKRLKHRLKDWNKNVFGDIFANLTLAEEAVVQAEKRYDSTPTEANLLEMNKCTAQLQHALSIEEDFWRQKATCRWMLEGERNTRFFHSMVRKKRSRTAINSVFHEGQLLTNEQLIKESGVDYFRSLLTTESTRTAPSLLLNIPRVISVSEGEALYENTNTEEVRRVIFGLSSDSTPGPDGFGAMFFQKCWEIIHEDVVETVQDFLNGSPLPLGFPSQWLRLVRNCITNCWFSILINGSLNGLFQSSRGLWQGDPLSPTLFVLTAEYFSRNLNILMDSDRSLLFQGSQGISHLAYVDDVLIFTNSKERSLQKIMEFLKGYEEASGQLIHIAKSSFIVAPKTPLAVKRTIKRVTGFVLKSFPFNYLGAPIYVGRKKIEYFDRLVEGMATKIGGWEKKFLSYRGRLQLIKSVLMAMPTHLFAVLDPPKGVLLRIERMLNKFFWGSSAFSLKLWWRFRTTESLWAGFLKSKYCKRSCPASTHIYSNGSPQWRRLFKSKDIAETSLFWNIGKSDLCFWHDNWLGDASLADIMQPSFSLHERVNYYWKNGEWDKDKLSLVLPMDLVQKVVAIPFDDIVNDKPCWKVDPTGNFSVKSAWELVRNGGIRRPFLKEFWHPTVTPSMSIFIWRLLHNFIPVDERLREKGLSIVSKCMCCHNSETVQHLFLNGNVAREVWLYFGTLFSLIPPHTEYISTMIHAWRLSSPFVNNGHIRLLLPILILWSMWRMRNEAKFNDARFSSYWIIRQVSSYLTRIYKAGGMKSVQWKGDLVIASKMGFVFPKPAVLNPKIIRWLRPAAGWWKLNCDGASKENPGKAGAGGIIRDCRGRMVLAFATGLNIQTMFLLNYSPLLRGFKWPEKRVALNF
ncbi:UNVERIFIED_CONTAM: putative ribonuclease H protein [Sesamum radiatum]|uniref:Ribonuclease H protein n=1 Tax=Sesamum radiatum TaxID=300843 RepID=A0AAW2KCK4_SESRA